jgi:hypothetical protein
MKLLKTLAALALAAAITALAAFGAEELDTAPAMAAAQGWLAYVDAGDFGKSWDESAAYFQTSIPKLDWQKKLDAARSPLGVLITRKIVRADYARKLPNAPDGEYVVIRYEARFGNVPRATESVTAMREQDGLWKVAGYAIRIES